jgi:hypothetical protein
VCRCTQSVDKKVSHLAVISNCVCLADFKELTMKSRDRKRRYHNPLRKIKGIGARRGAELRSEVRLSFDKANLFPFPRIATWDEYRWLAHASFGRSRKSRIFTFHMRKRRAYEELRNQIITEASTIFNAPVSAVVWRHTGGTGNFARNFIVVIDGEFHIRVKVGNRYREYRGDFDFITAHIPDALFHSAVDALYKFQQTGKGVWFPESRDKWVRENFPKGGAKWHEGREV